MDDWQAEIASTINRALNAAIDVTVAKETGVKTGILQPVGPVWFPNANQPNVSLAPGQAGTVTGAGLPAWLPVVLIVGALGLVVYKLAKR